MKSLTTIILVLIGAVIISGISFFGYQFYQKLHAPAESPVKAIPPNTALIIKLNKPSILWNQSLHDNILWKDLFSIPSLAALKTKVQFLDSAILKDQKIGISIRHNPLYVVVLQTMSDSYGLLYLINTPSGVKEDDISELIRKTWPAGTDLKKSSYAGSSIYQVNIKNRKSPFFFTIRSGIFIGSQEQILIKQAIDRLSLNLASTDDPNFKKIVDISGKNVDANIFINYQKIAPLMTGIFKNGPLADYLNVSNFAAWTGLDVIQKKEEWLVSGYTVCNENGFEYLTHFSDQTPQSVTLPDVLPANAVSFTWIGLSDPRAYYERVASSRSNTAIYKPIYQNLLQIENEKQIHLIDHFIPWTGNEMGLLVSENARSPVRQEVYGIFRITDRGLADSLLQNLAYRLSGQIKKETYKGNTIFTLDIPDLIPGVWGNLFVKLHGSSYSLMDDHIIFGNDPQSLKDFTEQVSSGNILGKNPDYQHFSENLSDQSNLCFYYNRKQSPGDLQTVLSDAISKEINPSMDSLKSFESFGVQIINNEENFITNILINHIKTEQDKGPLIWQTELDTVISGKPMIVMNALKGKPAVLACDHANTMYLVDWSGKIQWKLKLPGHPLGDIYEIRSRNPDSVYFLFTTVKQICLVDKNGLFAYNSPFPLPAEAVTGLACFEIPSAGNYRIFLPLGDKKIYSFDLYGKQIKGWIRPSMDEAAVKPVQYLASQNKDFLFITSKSGRVLITDTQGKPLIQPRNNQVFSPRSAFYLNKTNSKGTFLTSSQDGKLVYLKNDGKTSDLKFNNFSPDHIFFYLDFNLDQIQEFIYFDLNKIYFYNRFQKLLYDYSFASQILPPVLLKFSSAEIVLGTVSPKTGEVFLFGKNGLMPVDPSIRGNTMFDLKKMNEGSGTILAIGAGKYLRTYQLSK